MMGIPVMFEYAAVLKNAEAPNILCQFQLIKDMPNFDMTSQKSSTTFWKGRKLQVVLYND